MLEVSLFGSPILKLDQTALNPPTKKTLGIIAYLAINGECSREQLAKLFWSSMGEERARRNLRQELYRISSSALGEFLELNADSVRLTGTINVDVLQFKAWLEQDRSQALALYTAPLLEHFRLSGAAGFEAWLGHEREVLAEIRRDALALHASELARQGALREALSAYLESLKEDELQEHHHREVMRLHAMLGERGAALERFERLKRILRRDVGLAPLPETVALAERIRSGESCETEILDAVSSQHHFAPPLMGRESVWAQLETAAKFTLVLGEPGVGKTRLVQDFARAHGQCLTLRGIEGSSGTPFYAVAETIREASAELHDLEEIWKLEVLRLIPELEPQRAIKAEPPAPEGRSRFLEGLSHALLKLLASGGIIVLDDLHWFDASSLEVVALLTRRSNESVRLIATARNTEWLEHSNATQFLESLERETQLGRIHLEPLLEPDVRSLAQVLSRQSITAAFARQLYQTTAGNPLYLLETLRGLLDSSKVTFDAQVELPLFQGVQDAVIARVDHLGAGARRVLEAASLAGGDFDLELVAGASALTDWEVLEAIERSINAKLLEVHHSEHRFSHGLVARALEAGLSDTRRRLIHRKLAETLELQQAVPARIADHLERAGLIRKAIAFRVQAAQAASRVFAYSQALEHYNQALENGATDREAFEIQTAKIRLYGYLDDRTAWDNAVNILETIAAKMGDLEPQTDAKLERSNLEFVLGHYENAIDLVRQIRERFDLNAARTARALHREGMALFRLGHLLEAEAQFQAALEYISEHDFERIGELQRALSRSAIDRGDLIAAQTHIEAASKIYHALPDTYGEIGTLNLRGWIAHLRGENEFALECLLESLEQARQFGFVLLQRSVIVNLSAVLLSMGQTERAVPYLQEGLALAHEPHEPRLEAVFHTHFGHVSEQRGDLGGFLEHLKTAAAIFNQIGATAHLVMAQLNQAQLLLECGDPKNALPLLKAARQSIETNGLKIHQPWLEALQMQCDVALNRPPVTHRLERVMAQTNRLDAGTQINFGLAKLYLGDAAETLELVAGIQASLPNRAAALNLQLRAQVALRYHSQTRLEEALEILKASEISPLHKLSLYAAVLAALERTEEIAQKQKSRSKAQALMQQLAATLEPELQTRFLEHWSTRLETANLEPIL